VLNTTIWGLILHALDEDYKFFVREDGLWCLTTKENDDEIWADEDDRKTCHILVVRVVCVLIRKPY